MELLERDKIQSMGGSQDGRVRFQKFIRCGRGTGGTAGPSHLVLALHPADPDVVLV